MNPFEERYLRWLHIAVLTSLLFTLVVGIACVIWSIRPFWLDEWFIIWNLKNKNMRQLFGPLDLMQQFPRVYLVVFKAFASSFGYSYWSLRLPSLLASIATLLLGYRLSLRLFPARSSGYLFVLMIVSSFTYAEYMVQAKQYSVDIFLGVLAIWQLDELWLLMNEQMSSRRYLLLIASFATAPFFSYTYPIVITPVYLLAGALLVAGICNTGNRRTAGKLLLPLVVGMLSLSVFYIIDLRQLMADKSMYGFWNFLLFDTQHPIASFCRGLYSIYSQAGSGDLFMHIFGCTGLLGFGYAIWQLAKRYKDVVADRASLLQAYSCLLIIIAICCFVAGKLPLGTSRLNSFALPSVAILVINFIDAITGRFRRVGYVWFSLLFVALWGNIFIKPINYFTGSDYQQQLAIYRNAESGIRQAQQMHIPIAVTGAISFPYETNAQTSGGDHPETWILTTYPAYNMVLHVPVYPMSSLARLPTGIHKVMVIDGVKRAILNR